MIQYSQNKTDDRERVQEYFPDYTYRWVDNLDSLSEKIRIFEQGFDDRIIEMMKYFLSASLREQNQAFAGMLFYDLDQEGRFVFQLKKEDTKEAFVQCNAALYEKITPDYLAYAEQVSAVDQKWALQYIEAHGLPGN